MIDVYGMGNSHDLELVMLSSNGFHVSHVNFVSQTNARTDREVR